MTPLPTLDITDLAKILRMTPKAVQNRLYRQPESLPPRLKLPLKKSAALWLAEDVQKWLEGLR